MSLNQSRHIIVQGMSCVETGGRIVLKELIKAVPKGRCFWVLCTMETAKEINGHSMGYYSPEVYIIGLSHRAFGRWLRLLVEIFLGMLSKTFSFSLINLSNYGICWSPHYVLYIHSPLLMDLSTGVGMDDGRPNFLKRWMLNGCIRRASRIILQTQDMARQFRAYCQHFHLPVPMYQVVAPKIEVETGAKARREFGCQLFYPASRFPHKRVELAIAAARLAHAADREIGLVITCTPGDAGSDLQGVAAVGRLTQTEVFEWYAGSDMLLFTSERETLGLPLLEALTLGIPVVAPRLPYALQILGDAGCYFDDPTPHSVAQAVKSCRSDYAEWQKKTQMRVTQLREHSATWREHWDIFLQTATASRPSRTLV